MNLGKENKSLILKKTKVLANMIFTCQGKSTHGPIGSMWVPDDLTVFDNVIDYLEKVSEEVIPPSL